MEIARRSRGTPRIANRILRRVRDYAQVRGDGASRSSRRAPRCAARHRRARARRHGPQRAAGDHREVRRRPGWARNDRRRDQRGVGHDHGCVRAVPAAVRIPAAHAARARGHARSLPPPRAGSARERGCAAFASGSRSTLPGRRSNDPTKHLIRRGVGAGGWLFACGARGEPRVRGGHDRCERRRHRSPRRRLHTGEALPRNHRRGARTKRAHRWRTSCVRACS